MFAEASAPSLNLSEHIGASTATTAALAFLSANSFAVLPNVHPPQPKPMTTVATKPANAPCNKRVSESPCRIEGISMVISFDKFCSNEQRRPERDSGQKAVLELRPLRPCVSAETGMRPFGK